jgi:HEAT repeat protein
VIPPLRPTFDAALRDVTAQQPRFRLAAAARLAEPPVEQRQAAIRGLLSLAEDPNGNVREAAYESLGVLGAVEGLALLLEAFDDAHVQARQAAVLAVGRIDSDRGAEAAVALLGDARPEMRFASLWTLSSLGGTHASAIATALGDPDAEVRLLALRCLSDLDALEHADAMAALLDDPVDAVRFEAASSLARLGDARGAGTLRAALRSPDRAFAAAIGLGDLADDESRTELRRLATHRWRSPLLRAAAARALVRLGDPLGTAVIQSLVRSWRIEARQYAVQLVGELELTGLFRDVERALKRCPKAERPAYEVTLEQLAPKCPEAAALLASLRAADHPD